jgi:hypothetical protein
VFLFLLGFLLRCHGSILPSIDHGLRNDVLLQLIECIESIKSDVKKKMMLISLLSTAPKSQESEQRRNCITQIGEFRVHDEKSFQFADAELGAMNWRSSRHPWSICRHTSSKPGAKWRQSQYRCTTPRVVLNLLD